MIKTYSAVPLITEGNFPFSDMITINTDLKTLTLKKRSLSFFEYKMRSLAFKDIGVVTLYHRSEWLLFSRIEIESSGGQLIIISGLEPEEAKEIKFLIDHLR